MIAEIVICAEIYLKKQLKKTRKIKKYKDYL